MNEEFEIIRNQLRQLPLSILDHAIPGVYQFLFDMGEEPTNDSLAEAIVIIKGTTIFEDKVIRAAVFQNYGLDPIVSWAKNSKCSKALKSLGLSENFLPLPRKSRDVSIDLSPQPQLHDYQDWMKRKVSKFLLSGTSQKLMVQMPTGSGKTWTMMESIYDFLRITEDPNSGIVWIAHRDELCEQAVESFLRGWPNRGTSDVEVLRLWGGNLSRLKEIPNGAFFAVTSFQSAYSMITTSRDDIFHLFSKIKQRNALLIVDEAHQAKAPTYETSINLIKPHKTPVVGLSATPGRDGIGGDGQETKELSKLFDDNLFTINAFCADRGKTPIRYLQDKKVLSSIEYTQLKTEYAIELDEREMASFKETMQLPESFLKRVGEDIGRNTLIMAHIIKLVENFGKKPLIFTSSKDNSDFLATLLVYRGIKAKSVTGETSFTDRQKAVEDFRNNNIQALLNYGVFTMGYDDPRIDCIVIARPTTSIVLYSQMIGRGLRGPLNGGTDNCLVVDVIDNINNQPDIDLANDYFQEYWN